MNIKYCARHIMTRWVPIKKVAISVPPERRNVLKPRISCRFSLLKA